MSEEKKNILFILKNFQLIIYWFQYKMIKKKYEVNWSTIIALKNSTSEDVLFFYTYEDGFANLFCVLSMSITHKDSMNFVYDEGYVGFLYRNLD